MRLRACAALLLFLSACAVTPPSPGRTASRSPRIANLQRAAALPWTDGGRCVVREASQPWPVLVERCYQALDHDRVEFHDTTGRCAVASAGAAAVGVGFCVLAAPEIAVGAVIVIGVVVVAVAIKEALDAYELRHLYPKEAAASRGTKGAPRATVAERKPKLEPEPAGRDWQPPVPPVPVGRSRRDNCEPIPVNHRGGNDPHNKCADKIPNNSFPGWDVFVNGKNFDALQLTTRVLWEVKTDNFDTFSDFLQGQVIRDQVPEMRIERDLARACGFDFRVGVRSEAHKDALEEAAPDLKGFIVVMDWC
ncbi:hypothetical protein D7V80_05795 [Corallococcus sp. CA054B]|uniref:DUF6310 domain-containing protein n=1 Tax=Corallococcus sp. CA054B TaxID=2316734 RepID=UPI000EA0F310|nr:DUF6310 domain-containing protein [Corallococcus sp. CA054B]RKG70239.1 hypothetical protein D7V80_05795 [Corallococcus sp. CA054B]